MCNWRRWVWPGILATVILTALAMFFHSSSIEQDLTAKAGSDLQAEHPWASVELDGRDLTVQGVAPSEAAAAAAGATALAAYDVRVVADATTLPPLASPYPFKAIKNADGITLTGNYPSEDIRAEIVAAAEAANPGVTVTDEMTLARGAPEGFAALAAFGLTQVGTFTEGETSLSDLDYNIKGMAPDSSVFEAETAKVAGSLPSAGNLASAEIMAPTMSPYTWTATKGDDETITLTGFAPSGEARSAVEAAAAAENPSATIVNELQLAQGAPDGYADLTTFGLGQLNKLDSGEASLSDANYSIRGVASTPAAYAAEIAAANDTLPGAGALAAEAITPATVSPYTWSATKSQDNTITLSGLTPSADSSDAVEAAAAAENEGATIVNELQIALGAPADYDALTTFGLAQLDGLQSGTASLTDSAYAISGIAATSASFDAEVAAANGDLPGAATLANEAITPPAAEGSYNWAANKAPDGTITLTGLMPDNAARDRIAARAAELHPDATIINQMQIASGAPDGYVDNAYYSLGYLPNFVAGAASLSNNDLNIQGRALDADSYDQAIAMKDGVADGVNLADDISLPAASGAYEVIATRNSTAVTMTGFAPSADARSQIEAAAEQFGLPVVNRIALASGAPEGVDWGQAGASVVEGLQNAATGTARLSGTTASVDADLAPETVDTGEATDAFNGSMAAGVDLGTVTYRLPRISPYIWKAERGDNMAVLSGYVPSSEADQKIVDKATATLTGRVISNKQQLASGAPRGFEAAASVGLASINRLDEGVADIEDTTLTVTGVALTPVAKTDIERKVRNGVPPGFTGVPNISVLPAPLETGGLGVLAPNLCQLQLNNTLEGGINFETDKADILEASYGVLDQLAYTAQQCPDASIEIGGHTDSDGSEQYNQTLSERRASAVANYLIVSGVSSARLSAVGYGELEPIATNDTEEGKAQNRRIEFVISQ